MKDEGDVEWASLPTTGARRTMPVTVRTCASGVPILLLGGVWGVG